jgi:hypothetical protein
MRYGCNILNRYDESRFEIVVTDILQKLGFEPLYFDVFFDEFKKVKEDLSFDAGKIISLLSKEKPGVLTIKSALYDDLGNNENYNWVRIRLNIEDGTDETIGKTFLLEWSNIGNLDFLMSSQLFADLLKHEDLVYCYCYDSKDAMQQSNTNYNEFSKEPLPDGVVLTLNEWGDRIIDISKNWGRMQTVRSITFMAAPLMWFGQGFDTVLKLKEMRKFKYARYDDLEKGPVYIELLKLGSNPSLPENRLKQKEYWDFLSYHDTIRKYDKANRMTDGIAWYRKRVKQLNKKKK